MALETIRNFAKLFTNLTPDQQLEFERALVELQNSLDTTSLTSTIDLLTRRPDQSLPIPQVTITRSVRGGVIQWTPLPDQKINFFEIDISDTSNFATFSTVTTFSNQATISGITNTKFIRVRGVRKDGTSTPYSTVSTISPRVFDVKVKFQETFYVRIPKGSNPPTSSPFYPVGRIRYTPVDPDAKSMVMGFVSLYADPCVMTYGLPDIQMRLIAKEFYSNGAHGDITQYWRGSAGEWFGSYSVGPFAVTHPTAAGAQLEVRLEVQDGTQQAGSPGTEVQWAWLSAYEVGLA